MRTRSAAQPLVPAGILTGIRSTALLLWTFAGFAPDLRGQVIESTSGPLVAYIHGPDSARDAKRLSAKPPRVLSLYAAPYLGVPGSIAGADSFARATGYHFPVMHFMISAASRVQSASAEAKLGSNLRQLNAHIRVDPLDSIRRPIGNRVALEILEIQPNTVSFTAATRDTTTASGAVIHALSRVYVPIALGNLAQRRLTDLVTHFRGAYRPPDTPTQVSYISAAGEFGWTWYEHAHASIEGLHGTAALLQAAPGVRYVKVSIDVIAEWLHHGSWRQEFTFLIDIGAGS
jgi:hypothetical protein